MSVDHECFGGGPLVREGRRFGLVVLRVLEQTSEAEVGQLQGYIF